MTRTSLYRAFDAAGTLLYVGISTNPEQRWREHAISKAWWRSDVSRKTIEWHESRTAAGQAEAVAVRTESPVHNLALPDEDGTPKFSLIAPRMPRKPAVRSGSRRFPLPAGLGSRFNRAVERSPDPEADMSKVLRSFVRWYVRDPGAKLPDRPTE